MMLYHPGLQAGLVLRQKKSLFRAVLHTVSRQTQEKDESGR